MARSELDTSEKMMIHLSTEARAEDKEKEEKTIYRMKASEDYDDKVKALNGALKADLALTYAFLLDTSIDDPRVAKLTQPGLQKMVALRCTQLVPQWCYPCGGKLFHFSRGEAPVVTCRRCKRGACSTCYGQEAVRQMTKYRYLCQECDDIVNDDVGEGRLLTSDFDKAWARKNASKTAPEKTNPKKDATKNDKDETTLEEVVEEPSQKDMFQDSVEEVTSNESGPEDEESVLQRNAKLLEKKKEEKKLKQKEKKENDSKTKKKETICPHLKKGRCHFGLSGRKHNRNKTAHDEKQCRSEKLCECPFTHPQVCGKLLRRGTGRNGCSKGKDCNKLHPTICGNSLRGVCHIIGCNLGLHIQGTNTKEAREKDKKEREEERKGLGRRVGAGGCPTPSDPRTLGPSDPELPAPRQPQALHRVLGQQQQRTAAPSHAPSAPTPAPIQGQGQAGLNQETSAFLGQLLLGELLRRMQQETPPVPRLVEGRQEARLENRQEVLSLESLLRRLTLPQQN